MDGHVRKIFFGRK